jgi:hypothetical protein
MLQFHEFLVKNLLQAWGFKGTGEDSTQRDICTNQECRIARQRIARESAA